MQEPRNLSWTHYNKARRFPLMFDSTAVSKDGLFTIPDDLIVSLYLSCNVSGTHDDPGLFYIGELTYYHTGFVLEIYYGMGDAGQKVAETTVDLSSGTMPKVVQLLGLNPMILSGLIVLGDIERLSRQPVGEWSFDPSATMLDPFCVRYVAKELSELYVQSQGQLMGPFHGTVTFEEGENITLGIRTNEDLNCLYPTISGSMTEVVIHANNPEAHSSRFRSINGVFPDETGNITFKGMNCLDIRPEGVHTLVFDDKCAQPCCSCTELVPIEEKIKEITSSMQQLVSRMGLLETQYEFMRSSLSAVS